MNGFLRSGCMARWSLAAWCVVVGLTMAGCGGGGAPGVDNVTVSPRALTLSALQPRLEVRVVQGNPATTHADIDIVGGTPPDGTVIGWRIGGSSAGPSAVLAAVRYVSSFAPNRLEFDIDVRADLPAGSYEETVDVALCEDQACSKIATGPVTVRVAVTVLPNLSIAPLVELRRTGAEAAPSVDVPIDVPAEAGDLIMSGGGRPEDAVHAELVGKTLRVTTTQVRAGTYDLTVQFNTTQPGYRASSTVRYIVSPPPGGERGMTVSPAGAIDLAVTDGQVVRRRFTVTRPTWSSAPLVAMTGILTTHPNLQFRLEKISDLVYDLVVDTAGLPPSNYGGYVLFGGQPDSPSLETQVNLQVEPAVRVAPRADLQLTATTLPAAAQWSSAVTMVDGGRANWSATTSTPWLRLVRASGVTGQDALTAAVDTAMLPWYPFNQFAIVTLTVDRPGTLPVNLSYNIVNLVPAISVSSPGALAGTRGRIVLAGGSISRADLVEAGLLKVSGGTLRGVTYRADPRMLSNQYAATLEVDGLVAGTPVTVSIDTPLLKTSASLPVLADAALPAGRTVLPFGVRRPPVWSERQRAWYFAGSGQLHRLGLSGAQWALVSGPLAGVIDADLTPEESTLFALAPDGLRGVDPATLTMRWQALPPSGEVFVNTPDARATPWQKAIVHNADGAVFIAAGPNSVGGGNVQRLDFDWQHPTLAFGWQFASTIIATDPANVPFGLATSAARETQVMAHGTVKDFASRAVYRASGRSLTPGYADAELAQVAEGQLPIATDDAGRRFVTAAGQVQAGAEVFSLASVLPAGRTALGHTISGDGNFALVYSVRLTGAGASQTAADPQIGIVDLRGTPMARTLFATVAMTAPVGCGTPRALGETCAHDAALAVDSRARMVLVLGPRGAEVVPLPATVRTAAAAPLRRVASATSGPAGAAAQGTARWQVR